MIWGKVGERCRRKEGKWKEEKLWERDKEITMAERCQRNVVVDHHQLAFKPLTSEDHRSVRSEHIPATLPPFHYAQFPLMYDTR